MVVAVSNQKGGCGKSTVACHLAVMSAVDGKKTLLVDMDPQGSALAFREIRSDSLPNFIATKEDKPLLHRQIDEYTKDYERIIVDSGGRDSKLFRSAMLSADLIVIPYEPGQFDFLSLQDTLETLGEVRSIKDVDALIVLNKLIVGTKLSSGAFEEVKRIADANHVKIAHTQLGMRVGYSEAIGKGMSVTECHGDNFNYPKVEMKSLYEEIFTKE